VSVAVGGTGVLVAVCVMVVSVAGVGEVPSGDAVAVRSIVPSGEVVFDGLNGVEDSRGTSVVLVGMGVGEAGSSVAGSGSVASSGLSFVVERGVTEAMGLKKLLFTSVKRGASISGSEESSLIASMTSSIFMGGICRKTGSWE